MAIPETQKAWMVVRRGDPSSSLELQTVPVPTKIAKGDVLIKVQAASLNPAFVPQ